MTYEEELRQHYLQVKKRLYNSGIKKIAPPKKEPEPKKLTWPDILDEVCLKHGISRAIVTSKTRRHDAYKARIEAICRIRNEAVINHRQITIGRIAKIFNMDDSTIERALKKYEEMMGK